MSSEPHISQSAQDAFILQALTAGCPQDQVRRLYAAQLVLQPRQLEASAAARLCDRPDGPTEVAYGGARGGGKSFWLLAQMAADDCQRYPGLKCLLLRKVGKANLEHLEDLRRKLLHALPHTFTASRGLLEFKNGSRIVAGHFQKESDIDAYLGLEYDLIGVEEATTLSERKYIDISTCCRTSKPGWRPRMYSTTNPGGVGHAWYKNRFVVPFRNHCQQATRFIHCLAQDNRCTNAEYARQLDSLKGWQRRAWLDGDWDLASGQFFSTFRRDQHVISTWDNTRATRWFAALDYGFTHYTVALLGCDDNDGNIVIVDEHAGRHMLPESHAEAIKAMFARHGVSAGSLPAAGASPGAALVRRSLTPVSWIATGPDVFGRESTGQSVAARYRELGLVLSRFDIHRVHGWAELLHRLGDPTRGVRPTLFIHERCRRLIDCLPTLRHDPSQPEDVLKADVDEAGDGGDDAADACRYLVASRPHHGRSARLEGF